MAVMTPAPLQVDGEPIDFSPGGAMLGHRITRRGRVSAPHKRTGNQSEGGVITTLIQGPVTLPEAAPCEVSGAGHPNLLTRPASR